MFHAMWLGEVTIRHGQDVSVGNPYQIALRQSCPSCAQDRRGLGSLRFRIADSTANLIELCFEPNLLFSRV